MRTFVLLSVTAGVALLFSARPGHQAPLACQLRSRGWPRLAPLTVKAEAT